MSYHPWVLLLLISFMGTFFGGALLLIYTYWWPATLLSAFACGQAGMLGTCMFLGTVLKDPP